MPVMTKKELIKITYELKCRYGLLLDKLESRGLHRASEGCKRHRSWLEPNKMSATKGDAVDIGLAVDDFKNILSVIRKLK